MWLIILLLLTCSCGVHANTIERDKQLHFVASYGLTLTSATLLNKTKHPALNAALIAFSIGLVKELTDRRIDNGDLLANGLGITSAVIVYNIAF